ncbi:DUF1735 and LamG domain-containing protein [Dysgonomonas sp. 25]|uniref:DUF1735 and LamG domain-containing protein n=1 Tax=Dysgonomonas sp. 25 TaxID=2302933 RepID=UPI0013D6742C|nr:DUF1735 and LamG domain-containing protein [Dysgonomonas sp. 25]NDV70171.1 DUF1735 domain-containing protein [Dysgonomonas sp. 25]
MRTKFLSILFVLTALLVSCSDADGYKDVTFITGAEVDPINKYTVEMPKDLALTVSSSSKMTQNVTISLDVDENLLTEYNNKYKSNALLLPSSTYTLDSKVVEIPSGSHISEPMKISLNDVSGLVPAQPYILPVKIVDVKGGFPVLESARVVYLSISRTLVTKGAKIAGAYFLHAFSDDYKAVEQFSMETKVYIDRFSTASHKITSIMGWEENFLLRCGDTSLEPGQLELAGGATKVSISEADAMTTGRWYHVAATYDGTGAKVYIDGKLVAQKSAARGPIDMTYGYKDKAFVIGISATDGSRRLYGVVSEARLWSKALTQEEIANNVCFVDPTSPNLIAYWRLDGSDAYTSGGSTYIRDATGKGLDLKVGGSGLSWVEVRCPN